jgi:chromosomal replication initiation ATPase DnaA
MTMAQYRPQFKAETMIDVHYMIMRNYYSYGQKTLFSEQDVRNVHADVCAFFGVDFEDSLKRGRKRPCVLTRHTTMLLCRSRASLHTIARGLGYVNKGVSDHSTIIHGVNSITRDIETNERLKKQIIELKARLGL